MQYNKNEFMKSNDKKIMKKVKKQWVVVSIATLAFLGASAYGMMNTNVSASADTVAASADNQFNNSDETAKYSSQIQQGYTDAYQNKGNQSSTMSGQAANYYNAGYAGAQSAMNAYVQKTQGVGAGNQDYNYYGNTVTKQDGFQNDNADANSGTQGSANKRKTAGDNGNAAKTQTTTTTTEATNPTDGTPLNYSNPNNINQGGADNPKDASNSVATYESTMLNKVNTANNISVKVTSPTQAINIPTANTDVIVNDRNKYANAIGLRKAFDQGVNYALQQQGMADAESGKWQGVTQGSGGQTKDYYLSSNTNDSTNVYDQAYRGARDAMNAYFNSSNAYQGNGSVQTITTGTADYQAGYNDVVNQASQGIVYVQNGQQYSSAMTGSTTNGNVGGNIANNINTIRLANDIDLTNATNGENDGTVNTNSATITVDGQNHMMDFHGNNYTINRVGSGSLDVYLQNFQTMYGANYFGAFRAENGAVFHFSNINYVGPQLLSSYNNDTYFSGNVNVLVPTASIYYTSPFQSNVLIEGSGNQENLEVNNFILEPNSNYFGNTSPALGGTNVVVTGNFTLGENSKMTLIPRGGNGGAATIADGSTWGVWLKNAGASLNINKNATLNIIPQLYNNQKNLFGGAIYSGANVSININGGTLNYEGYNGISGYYNQPVDIQGSKQTQINVINGGVMQILMDSVPDVSVWNSYAGHQSTYGGLINNVGQGSFNIGSRGNLKVGVTNSDSTYNVPYFGPININSVGSNHAIFLKSGAVKPFQTNSGTSGQTLSGNINAYTVAVTQADGSKQYLYNFNLPSGSNQYSGIDFNGDNKQGTISGNTLDIADVPAVQFVGPLTKQTNSDGTVTVTGYAKLSNYKELNNQPIYVGVASSNSNPANYNSLTAVPNTTQKDDYSKADPNLYVTTVDTTGYTGGIIPISYTFAKGANTNYIGMRLHYGINSVNSILTPTGYNSTVEGYKDAGNGKVVEDTTNGDMQIANGTTANIQAGINDALSDSINNSSDSKNSEPFATKTNADYLASYSSIQAGYAAFDPSNPNQDYTQLASYANSASPSAFAQGYREAAYQSGLNDARFNKTTVQGNANYAEAQNQYNQAYQAALNAGPGVSVNTIISQNNLPTVTSNGTAASAVTTAISDAQGALAFISDEQAATINGTNYQAIKNDKAKLNAYNDAETGYNNALSVDHNADNPDTNADKAETAGFEYGQSLINGGLSSSTPTATAPHMTNLQAAISGYNAAQAAISKANNTNIAIIQRGIKSGTHTSMNTDGYQGDLTAYQSVKYGAYMGLANQSDSSLNSLEKVGYNAVVIPVATQLGQQAFMSKSGNTPTGVAALSDAGKQAFINAYNQAQTDYNAGQSQGLTDAQANNKTSNVPSNIPSSVINSDAYKLGYKGSVDGYADGSLTSAGTQNAKDSKAQPAYNDAYNAAYALGRQTAGGNDYVQYKQPKASDADYKTGYSQAQQGHDDGYNDAKSTPNPQPTKSSTIPYVTGYKSGVADEQADATNAANDQGYVDGGNDFLNNVTRPTTVAQINNKSVQYTTNYFKAFDASQQGFIDAQANKTANPSQYSDAKQQAAYQAGFQAFSTVQAKLASDSQSEANADNANNKLESVTNDTFKAFMASLRKTSYTNVENNNGNLYKLIANNYQFAQASYDKGKKQAADDTKAKGTDVYSQLAIDQYNDGHSDGYQAAKTSDSPTPTKSSADSYVQGFNKGVSDEQRDASNAADAQAYSDGQNDFLNNVTRPQQTSQLNGKSVNGTINYFNSYDAAEAGFIDGIANSANNTNKYTNATLQAAYSAGYNAAVNKVRAQLNNDEQNINSADTPASSDTTADKSVTAANEVFKANYDSLKGINHTPDSNINTQGNLYKDINNVYSKEAGQKYNEGIDAVQKDKNAKSANTIEQLAIDQYNTGHADGYEAAKNSSNPQANSTAASYVQGFSKGVSDEQTDAANAANSQAFVDGQNDFLNNVTRPQTVSQLSGKSTTATTNYFNAYDAAEDGFKDALSQTAKNTSKYTDTDLQNAYNNGYDTAVNKVQAQLTKDEQDVNNANTPASSDTTADKSVTAANEVFKANYDNLKDVAHTADSKVNTNGNLYNDINTIYSQSAGNKYNAGLAAVQQNKNATSSNTIEQLAIDQYNDGHTDGYEAAKTSDNPTPTKSSATSYTQGFHQGVSDEKAAQQGFKADVLRAEQQTDPDHPSNDGQSDAFKGAADALKNVYDNGGNQPHITNSAGYSDDYVNAYNLEIDKANAANEQAKNDMTNGVAKNSDNINEDSKNNATKAIYNHAYDQVATGFGAGLNSTNGTNYPSNADQQYGYNTATGYETGKSLAAGYQAAMNDFLAGKTDSSANAAPGYADTMKALVAAKNGTANPSTSALSKYAYSQELATKNAINDSINGNTKGNVPDGVDPDVYNEAYKAAKDGFADGSTSGAVQSTNKDNTDTSLSYTASYTQALNAARAQQGAKDYVNGTINSNSQNTDPSYAAGITAATSGFNDGKSGQDNTATSSNPAAYAIGLAAGQSAKRGIDEAQSTNDPSKLIGDARNAYYGVKDAYADVENNEKPSTGVSGVQTGSQAYTSAYNDALTTAQAKANDGASAFAGQTAPASKLNSDGTYNPSNDDNDKAYASGYNQALAGYNAAKSGNIDSTNTNSSYQAGVGLAKDLQTGINIAKTNSGQASDPAQQAAIDAVKQAYTDAKNGVDNPTNVPSNDAAYAKIYQDAYNQVKQDAKNDINNGVQNYLSGGNKSGNSDIDSQQSDAAFDKAAQGYIDGSAAGATNQHPNDVAYTKGFDAAKSVQQAIADKQNNTNNSSDSSKNPDNTAYNNAAQGYTDGLAAVTSSTTPAQTGVEYTTAYNQALKDGQTAYNTGVNNALSSLSGSENDGNPIGSYGTNSPLGGVAKQGFDDVKAGFDNEIQNALGNNPTPISNPNAANTEGTKLAQSVENAITTALASADNINAPKISGINNDGLTNDINGAIAEAYKNYRDASATDKNGNFTTPTSFTPAQQLAYNDAIAKLQSEEKANLKAAQQDVMRNNVDNHKDSNVDIYNKAKAMVDGISDANDDNPTNDSKYASDNKDAYDQGKDLGVKNRATGAQAYLNGSSEPAGSDALSGAQKTGYDLARLGFQEATDTNGTAPSKPNDPNYMAGYDAAKAVKAVERNNANNDKNATYADKASATQAQSGYTDAITAFKNASDPANVNDAFANQSPAYTQAYKDTVDKLKQDYQNGRDQFKNGQLTADTTGIANADEQKAVQQGLADENAGFTAGLTGDTTFKPANGAQSDGQSLGQKVKSEIQAANDSGHTVDTGSKILDDAINKARQAVENDSTVSDTNYPEGLSDLAKQVYMASVDSFKASYQNGVNSVVTSGATKPAPAANDNSFTQKGASDATAAIDAGFAGTDKPNALDAAYQLGQDARNGYLKAIGQNTTPTTSDAANTGNQAASQAITDQTSTPAGNTSLDDKSEVYKLAYKAVKTNSVVESSKNDGALRFSKGQIEPTATDQVSQIAKDAYDAAAKGYADARDGKIDSNRQDDAYKTGIKAYQDAQAGIKLANQQTSAGQGVPATDPNNDNKPLSDSEKLAYQAVMDAYNGVNETNPGNPIYDEAYKQALNDKTSAEQKGATAELTGNEQPVTALQQSIYDNGKNEAKTGYENAQQDMTSSVTDYNTGVNQKDAENGAALAFQDALNGKPQSAPTQASEVFKDAYNKAYAESQGYIKDGEAAANKKQNPNLSGSSAKNRLTQAAYDQFTNGYNTQMANVDSNAGYPTNNQTPMFSDGVNKAKEVQAAIANYENSGFVNGTDKTDALQTLADQAYQDGINGNTDYKSTNIEPSDAQALEKTDVYSKIQDYATNVVNGAKALFNNDNQDSTKGDSLKINPAKAANDKAFNKGLDQASAALKDAMQNDSSMDAKYDPQTLAGRVYFATKMAYNQVAPNGSSEYNGKVDVANDATAKATYDAALANAKRIASQSSQDASNNVDNSANYSGLAKIVYDGTHSLAKGAFSDALKGINADKYTGNDEGSITYQAVQNAINDYLTNDGQAKRDPNKANISADKADVYTAAYNQALAMVNKAAGHGLSMYQAGNSDEQISSSQSPNDSLNKVAVESARRAKAGHDDSINNEGHVSDDNKSIAEDSSYLAGLKGAKDADKGVEMALADSTKAPDADASQAEKDGFNGTVDGYHKASTDGSITPEDIDSYVSNNLGDKSVAYRDAFKNAYLDGLKVAKKGADAANANQLDSTKGQNGAAQKAQSQGYQDANNAFLDKLHGIDDKDATSNTPASVSGRQRATQYLLALQDVADGHPNTSSQDADYQNGLAIAQAALQQAVSDGKANKQLPDNLTQIPVPDGLDPVAYRDAYAGILSGFYNGYNSKSTDSGSTDAYYNIAFGIGYAKGKASIPTDTSAPSDFLNNRKMPTITDPAVAKAYKQQYDEAKSGFYDGLYNRGSKSNNAYYKASYKLAQDGLAGMRLAAKGDTKQHRKMLKNESASFVEGYNAYLKGVAAAKRTLKKNKKLSAKDLLNKDKLYSYTFKKGLKHEIKIQRTHGKKFGTRRALERFAIPKNIYTHHSESYARTYVATYKKEMKRHMPRYIYNVGTIFTHNHVKFTRHTRIRKYAYSARYNSTVFKVVGVKYYKNRIPRYRLSNGAVVTASQAVQNAYYKKHFKKYRVIKPTGVLIHTGKTFTKRNSVRRLYRGEVFHVRKVVKFYGITRLYIGKNEYITSNKTFVKAVIK
ncbi:hypothetical protein FD688_04310 [Apilactobacillus kunkeei]|uniref:DUF5776 domain-containing protein n=1 Tax=Apilactobacillus kunkeei TaxID=148814 RepID=UPI00110D1621|nr:DUF5776 domain-containing protein [Apilactobacillus kunkeei]TMT00402.1 hypothetical protein FD688_04310 [Apilactobacillus kunkeei]